MFRDTGMLEERLLKLIKDKFSKGDTYKQMISDYGSVLKEAYTYIESDFNEYEGFEEFVDFNDYVERHLDDATHPINYHNSIVTQNEIDAVEKKLNLSLPPSYKELITAHGLLGFGKDATKYSGSPYSMDTLNYVDTLWDQYDFAIDESDKEYNELKKLTSKLIVFANGDESLQSTYHICFNYHSLNEETGEVDVFFFDQGDHPRMFKCANADPAEETSMASYLRQASKIMLSDFFLNS